MRSAAICFAGEDDEFAKELSQYLEANSSVRLELAELKSGEAFLDLVEQCLTKDFAIVVLSPASVPDPWCRDEWERVFVGCARESGCLLAYVMRQNCPFPGMLRRRSFFDFTSDSQTAKQAGKMELRRWLIRGLNPERLTPKTALGERDESLLTLLDQPVLIQNVGRSGAEWLISGHWRSFENVYWVECGNWTRAGVLGELAHTMNLRLAGTVEENWQALKRHATEERALYVFEYLTEEFADLVDLGGKASVAILADDTSTQTSPTLADLKRMFFAPGTDEAACLRALGRFMDGEREPGDWDEVKSVGFRARLFFQREGRLAEAHELLVWLAGLATRHGDQRALEEIQREENWILDSWNLPPVERTDWVKTQPCQLWLPMGTQ